MNKQFMRNIHKIQKKTLISDETLIGITENQSHVEDQSQHGHIDKQLEDLYTEESQEGFITKSFAHKAFRPTIHQSVGKNTLPAVEWQ